MEKQINLNLSPHYHPHPSPSLLRKAHLLVTLSRAALVNSWASNDTVGALLVSDLPPKLGATADAQRSGGGLPKVSLVQNLATWFRGAFRSLDNAHTRMNTSTDDAAYDQRSNGSTPEVCSCVPTD